MEEFLVCVKEKFSDVLLPIENITKQDILGKGNHFFFMLVPKAYRCIIIGAFGVVHKGDLKLSDESTIPIAIKTITRLYTWL